MKWVFQSAAEIKLSFCRSFVLTRCVTDSCGKIIFKFLGEK